MKISLELLQLLDAVDRHGSLAAAAEALHRVPSALSHAVGKYESDLGIPLFERRGRRVLLNEAGQTLLNEGRLLLRTAGELERRVLRVATGWESELHIALDAIIPCERIFPLLAEFYAAGHDTRIRLHHEVLGGCWDALTTGRADLVIGAPGEMPTRGGISTRLLCTHGEAVFAVAPGHPLAVWEGPIPGAELARHRAIVVADTSQELDARSIGLVDGQPTLHVPDIRAKAAAQVAGLGIGHLPRWLAEAEIAAGRLVEKQIEESRPPFPLHLAWHNRRTGQALRWFLDELAKPEHIARLTQGL